MAHDDVEIKIVDRQTVTDVDSVDYQPFGVKVLKLRVRRNPVTRPDLGPIWLIPQGYVRPNAKSGDPVQWRAYGTAGGDPDLWVAWGAGDERGFCAKTQDRFKINKVPAPLNDDGAYYLYLHLIHRPADPFAYHLAEKSLTVQAVDADGQVRGEKTVQLTVPAQATNPVRMQWEGNLSTGVSTITLRGAGNGPAYLPLYVSRWWPTSRVDYVPVDAAMTRFLSDLKIVFHRQGQDADRGKIDVLLDKTPLAHIAGYLAPPLHDARLCGVEAFRFLDDYHLVVRLWFHWLHLNFSADQLLACVPAGQRAAGRAEAERVCAQLNTLVPYYKREEVPDIERFDLLLDLNDLNTKYVGTDTHWQEFWASVKDGEPLEAKIASLAEVIQVIDQATDVPKKKPPVFDPLANGLCDLVNEWSGQPCPHRGQGQLVPMGLISSGQQYAVCPRCRSHFTGQGTREVGLWDKHAPWLVNAEIAHKAVSTSVLDG